MKKTAVLLGIFLCIICLASCANDTGKISPSEGANQMYEQITPQTAKELIETESDYIILDVREQEEFDAGHIEGAILIPYTKIEEQAETIIPQKDQLVLVYCRSGRRSKIAADYLVNLGYTNVKEFGGIIDWPYEIVR